MDKYTERFWSRVKKTPTCWIWQGALDKGYGWFNWINEHGTKHHTKAHRRAYELLVGDIPKGLHIDHICRNTACVRPHVEHCQIATSRMNTLRGNGPASKMWHRSKCVRGHEFDKENTKIGSHGWRICIKCERMKGLKYGKIRCDESRRKKESLGIYVRPKQNSTEPYICINGHLVEGNNLARYGKNQHRVCRACCRERSKRKRLERIAAGTNLPGR